MAKVWLLSRGEYSDYSIIAVYDDEAKARAAYDYYSSIETRYNEPNELEEYEISTAVPRRISCLSISIQVVPFTGDIVGEPNEYEVSEWTFDGTEPTPNDDDKIHCQITRPYREGDNIKVYVEGYDHERVRKVFSERLAEVRAAAAGIA